MRNKDPVREIVNAAYQGPVLGHMWPDQEDKERAKWLVDRVAELEQLMAQGWSKAMKNELQCARLRTELYKAQRLAEGLSADFDSSPMAMQALPPVDDVSGLLDERLKRDAARIGELETAQQRRPMESAPMDGSEVLAWARHVGWSVLSWSNVRDGWVGYTQEWPTHWVYLPKAVDDTYTRGAVSLPDQSSEVD